MYLSILRPDNKGISDSEKLAGIFFLPGLQIQTHDLSCDSYCPPLFGPRFNRNSFL